MRFVKGQVAWNKGLPQTKKVKEKLRIKMLGRLPWCTGKKRPEISGDKNNNWRGGEVDKVCKECGKKFNTKIARKDTSKFCSSRCYWNSQDIKDSFSKENNPNWHGGTTSENMRIRGSVDIRLWRDAVFERDGYLCQMPDCDKTERFLNAHHIKKFSTHEELRLNINNGITLCRKCHAKTFRKEEMYEELFNNILKLKMTAGTISILVSAYND